MIQKKQFPTLQSLAINAVAKNYHLYPQLTGVPQRIKQKIVEKSINQSFRDQDTILIAAPHIQQQKYWKACCEKQKSSFNQQGKQDNPLNFRSQEKYKKTYNPIKLQDHGLSWKIAYFQKFAERMIQQTQSYTQNRQRIVRALKIINPWIFTLEIKINAPDLSIDQICKYLGNIVNLKIKSSEGKNTDYKKKIIGMRFSEARDLSQVLRTSQNMLKLNLSGNLIDDDLFKFISPGLTLNITLVQLNLSYNKIGDQGARRISKYLLKNQVLTHLNLSNNSIGYDGSRYLAQAIKLNETLEYLNLKLNSFDDKAGAKFFKDLAFNTNLKILDLQANMLGPMTVRKICLYLQVPNSLKQIYLGSNNFSESECEIIMDSIPTEKAKQMYKKSKYSEIKL